MLFPSFSPQETFRRFNLLPHKMMRMLTSQESTSNFEVIWYSNIFLFRNNLKITKDFLMRRSQNGKAVFQASRMIFAQCGKLQKHKILITKPNLHITLNTSRLRKHYSKDKKIIIKTRWSRKFNPFVPDLSFPQKRLSSSSLLYDPGRSQRRRQQPWFQLESWEWNG